MALAYFYMRIHQNLGVGDRLGPGLADGEGEGVSVGPADGVSVGEELGDAVGETWIAVKKAR